MILFYKKRMRNIKISKKGSDPLVKGFHISTVVVLFAALFLIGYLLLFSPSSPFVQFDSTERNVSEEEQSESIVTEESSTE